MDGYSLDLRTRVVSARLEAVETIAETAERFDVSVSFVTKLMARRRATGSIAAKPHGGGGTPKLDDAALALLRRAVRERPDATLAELAEALEAGGGGVRVRVSVPTVHRAPARLRLPLKKSRSTTTPGTRRGSAGCAGRSPARSARSRPANASTWTSRGPRPA